MKQPKFYRHDGYILILGFGHKLNRDTNIETNMEVTVGYLKATVTIKVVKKESDDKFIGKIIRFSKDTAPTKYEDLALNDIVEFRKEHIVVLDPNL